MGISSCPPYKKYTIGGRFGIITPRKKLVVDNIFTGEGRRALAENMVHITSPPTQLYFALYPDGTIPVLVLNDTYAASMDDETEFTDYSGDTRIPANFEVVAGSGTGTQRGVKISGANVPSSAIANSAVTLQSLVLTNIATKGDTTDPTGIAFAGGFIGDTDILADEYFQIYYEFEIGIP